MWKLILAITLALGISSASIAEETAPIDPTTTEVKAQNAWLGVGYDALVLIISLFGGTIVLGVVVVAKKVAKKAGLELSETAQQLIAEYAKKGIVAAEEWAKKQAAKPASENKKAEAVRVALELAGKNETVLKVVNKYAVDKLDAKIEALLRSDEVPAEVKPKA
jgi:hypothetical protein